MIFGFICLINPVEHMLHALFLIIVLDADDAGGTERCKREGRGH